MKKQKLTPSQENIWDNVEEQVQSTIDKTQQEEINKAFDKEYAKLKPTPPKAIDSAGYDLEGLQNDFPTAKKLKYQIAMDALNGVEISESYKGSDNPYIERSEMIPTDPMKEVPARDKSLPPRSEQQNAFYCPIIPHPDDEARAQDKKVQMMFRKYKNGMISYEILGPLETKPHGEKIDKFGRTRPEVIKWVDPRTGEQVIMREDGTLTPQGKRLRATMQTFKVNRSNQWEVWIDREFVSLDDSVANNPWKLT